MNNEQLDLEIRRHWCLTAIVITGPYGSPLTRQSCFCGNDMWPCPTLEVVQKLWAERDAERERRRRNVRRAWGWRRSARWSESWYVQLLQSAAEVGRLTTALSRVEAERDAARERAERLLTGLREIEFGKEDPSDYPDPNHCWCHYCDGMPPTHHEWCQLAALIREAEGA